MALLCVLFFKIFDWNLFYFSLPSLVLLTVLFIPWFLGFKSAIDEKETELAVVGKFFQKWIQFI